MTDNADKNQDADLVQVEAEHPDTESNTHVGAQPEQRSSGGGFVWLLAVLLVIGGGGYAVWPYVAPTVNPVLQKARATLGFEQRPTQPSLPSDVAMNKPAKPPVEPPQSSPSAIASPEPAPVFAPEPHEPAPVVDSQPQPTFQPQPQMSPVPVIEQTPPVLPTTDVSRDVAPDYAPMVQSLTDRLDILEAQLLSAAADTENNQNGMAAETNSQLVRTLSELRADLATLKTRVAALESAPRGQVDPSASAQALVLAVTQLAGLVESDRAYATALDALERIGGADPVVGTAVVRLRPYATSGVPSLATIKAEFKAVAVAVMKIHGQTERTGWMDEVLGAASGLVTVRQTDPARIEDPVERALAVAELALKDNDLKTALAAMQSLQGAEGNAANRWREAARARVEVREALNALHNHALAALAATGGA